MKQYLLTISLLFIICISICAQNEVLFDKNRKEDSKVESLKGLEFRITPYPTGVFFTQARYSFMKPYSISGYVGYFKEKRISSSWTLLSTIGLHNIAIESHVLRQENDTLNGYYFLVSPDRRITYSLMLEAGIEPRWYWGVKRLNLEGKAFLNSGWFLSFPLLFQKVILHTPEPLINQGWFPSILYSGKVLFIPTVGYRKAINNHWFVESSIGFAADIILSTNSIDHNISLMGPEYNPSFKLKAAYTLNK